MSKDRCPSCGSYFYKKGGVCGDCDFHEHAPAVTTPSPSLPPNTPAYYADLLRRAYGDRIANDYLAEQAKFNALKTDSEKKNYIEVCLAKIKRLVKRI